MSKAIMGAAELAGAAALAAVALSSGGLGTVALVTYLHTTAGLSLMAGLAASGISSEAGAIADALTSNRGTNITDRRPASNRQIVYGTQMVGGVLVYESVTGHQYNQVICIAGHQIHSIQAIYLDGRKVFFKGSGNGWSIRNGVGFGGDADGNDHLGPDGVTNYNFGGKVYVEARYGDQTFGDYMGSLNGNDPNWGPKPNGDCPSLCGVSYIYLKCTAGSQFTQRPEVRILVNGRIDIYDPRTSTTGFSNNAALVAANVITDTQYGLGDTNVDTTQLVAAANLCDEQVAVAALSGSTEKRYCCDYSYDTGTTPGDVLQSMMAGMAGRISNIGGSWHIFPGAYAGPTLLFDDSSFTAAPKWNPRRSVRDLPNRVTGTHISAEWPYSTAGNYYQDHSGVENTFDLKFQTSSFPYYAVDTLHGYPSDQYLTEDNGHIRPIDLSLPTVLSLTQCQRVAKINLLRARARQGSGTFEFRLGAYQLQPCDTFMMSSKVLGGWSSNLLEITGTSLFVQKDDQTGANEIRYRLNVQETASSTYSWSTAEELTIYASPAAPTQVPDTPNPPTNLALFSGAGTAIVGADGSVTPCIQVTWDTPQDPLATGIAIQYKVHGTSTWYGAWQQVISMNVSLINPVIAGQYYDVRIATQRSNGALSDWLEQDNFLVPALTSFLGQLSAKYPGGLNLPAPGADVTAQQPISYTGSNASIVPNGNFVLGTDAGWVKAQADAARTWLMELSPDAPRIHFQGGTIDGACSPSFSVTAGSKYKVTYRVYAGAGPQATYMRIASQALQAANVTCDGGSFDGSTSPHIVGFMENGSISPVGQWLNYSYDWTCPTGDNFASVMIYHWGAASELYCQGISVIPYAGVAQWGADQTSSNTSADTSAVAGVPATTIANVVPNGYKLFINSGSRSYSITAI